MKLLLTIFGILFIFTDVAHASSLSMTVPTNVYVGEQFTILLNLDTGVTSINSIDISLSYPKDIMTFKGYKEDISVKKLWLATPKEDSGVIHFSGIIPGGVEGVYNPDKVGLQPLPLIELIFSAKAKGSGELAIIKSNILKNDGLGTELVHSIKNSFITVSGGLLSQDEEVIIDKNSKDTELPEPFEVIFIEAGFFSKTPSLIIFRTVDNQSGIEKYQMRTINNKWHDVISPTKVRKGIISRDVSVRAVDFSGNVREAKVEIPGVVSPLQLVSIVVVGFICYYLFFVVKRRR